MENIELDFGNGSKQVDINFDNLNTPAPSNINISRNNNIDDTVRNQGNTQPNLTMSTSKEFNIGLDLLANPNKLKQDYVIKNENREFYNMKGKILFWVFSFEYFHLGHPFRVEE